MITSLLHDVPVITSLAKATVGLAVQLSDTPVTTAGSATGTSDAQATVIGAGAVATGSMVSFTVMVCVTNI